MGRLAQIFAALVGGTSPVRAWRHESGPQHNKADTRFVRSMIAHHTQTIELVELARLQSSDSGVVVLAKALELTRPAEVAKLSRWLQNWGEPLPQAREYPLTLKRPEHRRLHGSRVLVRDDEIQDLKDVRGRAFDVLWLQKMVEQHHRAVDAAKSEQADGHSTEAVRLARQVERSQSKVVTELEALMRP